MNPDLSQLQPYPFERLAGLLKDSKPPADRNIISLAVGEPQHAPPACVLDTIEDNLAGLSQYPATIGSLGLRAAIAQWLRTRFDLASLDEQTQVLPVNGTREALFAFAQAVIDRSQSAKVLMPNPGYQIYEGAALLAGAEPVYLPCTAENDYLPDLDTVDSKTWQDCQLLYLCSPGNPTGAVMSQEQLQQAISLAQEHDFVIASDECYSEIWMDRPPTGLLQAAHQMGLENYNNCVVFHSLSKRSNLPGLRSGFVAGDANILKQFLLYRTYHGCAMSPLVQMASISAWNDEAHVEHNRELYREKFQTVLPLIGEHFPCPKPKASFYIWTQTPIDDQEFTRLAFEQQALRIVPGSYLSRDINGHNPGQGYVRISLVPPLQDCDTALQRLLELSTRLG